jgi:hypothetical protein
MRVGTGVRQCPSSKTWDLMAHFENILSTKFKVGEGIRRWPNCTLTLLQHSKPNTVNELTLRTHQPDTVFQHSVSGCCQKHSFTGQWRYARKPSFGTDCICCLLPTSGWALVCGQRLVLTALSCHSLWAASPQCSCPKAVIGVGVQQFRAAITAMKDEPTV